MRYEIRLAKCRVMVCGSANCHGTSVCRAKPDSNAGICWFLWHEAGLEAPVKIYRNKLYISKEARELVEEFTDLMRLRGFILKK
ncbi:hypothetical protein T4D_4872 [Trichinella pseudospiralis]|uniref:Uncharacterized protein n=1 Tax=Trichinella pseudospiralis TaxID=6337 RepID=A0A0V1G300_TRIPS|nr:hypothetical protein T4D_4872 [Trichinella pseudospiralis]